MNKSLCTILLNTCDKYEEAWYPFFALFTKHWKDCPFDFVLNTESKSFSYDGVNITVSNSNNKNWGDRMCDALSHVKTPFVLCMLEDFFVQKKVREDEVYYCINEMQQHEDIGAFYFNRISGYETDSEYDNYYLMTPTEQHFLYIINCQASVWRKEVLISAAKGCENPWYFEERSFVDLPNVVNEFKFYCTKTSKYDKIRPEDVFSYLCIRSTGYGIYKSKWLWNNKKMFRKHGIKCKCNTLPKVHKIDYVIEEMIRRIKNKTKTFFFKRKDI